MLRRAELDKILTVAFAPFGFARIDEAFTEGYFLGLRSYQHAEVRDAIFACCFEPGRKEHPKPGEIIAEIHRVRRQEARNQQALVQAEMLALPGPPDTLERRQAIVDACRPVMDLIGTRPSKSAKKAAHARMAKRLKKLGLA